MKNSKKHILVCCVIVFLFALLSTLCYFGPRAEYSDSERRPLASFPALNLKSISSGTFMEQFETYAADTFPFREAFRSIKAGTTLVTGQKTNNDIYLHNGYLSKVEYPMNMDSIYNATVKFENIYDQYLANANTQVYISVIPDKNAYLAESSRQLSMDYDTFEYCVADSADFGTYISISNLLSIEDYYYTDSHWRQEQLVDVAEHLADSMGSKLPQSTYTKNTVDDPFFGVYHGQFALPVLGDTLSYLTNPVIDQLEVFDHEHNQSISVYDLTKTTGKDPYEMFLSGPLSLVTIENPMAQNHRELVIFRDSYASAIAPLLATGYSKVTLADIRYLPSSQVDRYITFENCDILFLYSTSLLNHSETLK